MSGARAQALDLRLLLPALIGWAVGAWALGWPVTTRLVVAGCALAVLLAAVGVTGYSARHAGASLRRDGPAVLALTCVALALVLGASAVHAATSAVGPVDELAEEGAVVRAEGVLLTEPVRRGEQVFLRVRLESVSALGLTTTVRAPVLVRSHEDWSGLGWHDRVRLRGKLSPMERADAEVAALSPRGPPLPAEDRSLVRAAAAHLRSGLREAVAPLPADARGLLPALVIGDTSGTPPDLGEDMLQVGMSHLSAVSGSNVAVVLAAVIGTCRVLGAPRRARPWLAGAGLAFFVVLARPEPSVMRAATMGAIGLIGLSTSRRGAGAPALSAAVLALLAVDPWLARSYGFALSTLATLGLLLFVGPWSAAINARLPRRLHLLGPAIAIPLAAQVVCAPVIVLLQGDVSLIAVLANLASAPFVAPATVLGVVAALVGAVSTLAATGVAWLGAPFALGIAWVARIAADVPGGSLPWPDGAPGALLLTALSVLALLAGPWLVLRSRASPLLALALVAVVAVGAVPDRVLVWPPEGWRLVACDVGQGDALVLASGPGRAVLVDAGPTDGGVGACLRRLGVRTLDAVVLTHFHADHVGGLDDALAGREVGRILVTPVAETADGAEWVRAVAQERGIPVQTLTAGGRLDARELSARAWWPSREIAGGSVANNASVVLRVRVGTVDALLLGDIEQEAGHAMLLWLRRDPEAAAAIEDLDVVKMPHHGSSHLDEDLMEELAAPVSIISVGEDNGYGHPTSTAISWARSHTDRLARTDRDGDVAVLDGPVVVTSG